MDNGRVIAEHLVLEILRRKGAVVFKEAVDAVNKHFKLALKTTELLGFIRKFSSHFELYENDGQVFVDIITKLNICKAYCSKNGSCAEDSACTGLHICKFYALEGQCNFGINCKYGHDLTTLHNARLLQERLLSGSKIDDIRYLLLGKRTQVTIPQMCKFYNNSEGCKRNADKCHYLHICKYYIQEQCQYGVNCRRNHNIGHNEKTILQKHGIETARPVKELLKEIRILCKGECEGGDDDVNDDHDNGDVDNDDEEKEDYGKENGGGNGNKKRNNTDNHDHLGIIINGPHIRKDSNHFR